MVWCRFCKIWEASQTELTNKIYKILVQITYASSEGSDKTAQCAVLSAFAACLFVALRPKSTAMVIAGRSVHLITLFPGQA